MTSSRNNLMGNYMVDNLEYCPKMCNRKMNRVTSMATFRNNPNLIYWSKGLSDPLMSVSYNYTII